MKTWLAFAVVLVVVGTPTWADDKVSDLRAEIELLELERDVDKSLIHEAFLMAGRVTMKEMAASAGGVLKFIEMKKESVIKRTAELKRKASELSALGNAAATRPNQPAKPKETSRDDLDTQELVEKFGEAEVEVELLQAQIQLFQQPLREALQALAKAEFTAGNDETKRDEAVAAREQFNKVKTRYVELIKKMRLQQVKITELRTRLDPTGMKHVFGPMGGMGGGMR